MSLELTYYGHPALRSKGRLIDTINDDIRHLAEEMIETMHEHEGCGLAAQQVGRSLQIAVIDILPGEETRPSKAWRHGKSIAVESLMPLVLINPKITPVSKKIVSDTEGCLSIPGLYVDIPRHSRVKIAYQDLTGASLEIEAEGLLARAAMHEVDHLHGILFIDHFTPQELTKHQNLLKKLQRKHALS